MMIPQKEMTNFMNWSLKIQAFTGLPKDKPEHHKQNDRKAHFPSMRARERKNEQKTALMGILLCEPFFIVFNEKNFKASKIEQKDEKDYNLHCIVIGTTTTRLDPIR